MRCCSATSSDAWLDAGISVSEAAVTTLSAVGVIPHPRSLNGRSEMLGAGGGQLHQAPPGEPVELLTSITPPGRRFSSKGISITFCLRPPKNRSTSSAR
jgi:hypothetical protein